MWNTAPPTSASPAAMCCWNRAPMSCSRSDLNFGYCKIAVAGTGGKRGLTTASDARSVQPTIRVATKYPRITMDYYNARGIPVEIIPLSGSIELAPLIGLADRIVDLVETGRTLKENGLEVLEVIAESSAQTADQSRRLPDQARRSPRR